MCMQYWRVSRGHRSRMMDDYDLCFKFLSHRRRIIGWANYISALYSLLIYASEVKTDVVSCLCRVHLCVVSFDRLYLSSNPGRHNYNLIVSLNLTGFHSANRDRAYPSYRIHVLNRDSEWFSYRLF